MDPREAIQCKRDGGRMDAGMIDAFVQGYVAGTVEDYHASAWLMAIFCHGLDAEELRALTRSMVGSGACLAWQGLDGPVLDKHSTGGVGDKISLPLAPALAALGAYVPMISGRGLGHTGGTLDKLEAVPGLSTELSLDRIQSQVHQLGMVFAGQTPEIVPADRKLYALRDAAGLVEAIPLIASSILSKKVAEGLDALVLDVKSGSGAFLGDPADGQRLADAMGMIASDFGLSITVVSSAMVEPLGRAVGHASEVNESLEVLRGGGPKDVVDLTVHLGAEVLVGGGLAPDLAAGAGAIRKVLGNGQAHEIFMNALRAQGGDTGFGDSLPLAGGEEWFLAPEAGYLACRDCREVGLALMELGGARRALGAPIDHQVGIECLVRHGQKVGRGEPVARLIHRDGHGLEQAKERLARAYAVDSEAPQPVPAPFTLPKTPSPA